MAETLLSFGVERLWDLLGRESDRFQGVEVQLNDLKVDLETLRCFLKDADAKKHTSATVKNILNNTKEIVYDAEDMVETFLVMDGKTSGITNNVRRYSCVFVKRRRLALDMEAISKRISNVIRNMQLLGVQQITSNQEHTESLQERQRQMRQTFSNDNESTLVGLGFDEKVTELVDCLVKEDNVSQVVSITGMGGIGKTTLARKIFHHETIRSHFAVGLVWVCVSQQFTRRHVWQTILGKLRPEYKVSDMTEDKLQEELSQILKTPKVLIVLDDLWREEDWDVIKPMFPLEKGWKVLLTSRYEGVGLRADPNCFTFKSDFLTPDESWTLFRSIAFPRENTTEYKVDKEMEKMGKHMTEHCKGLPLAVKVLGGLLAAKFTLSEWEKVCKNIRSHIIGETSFDDRNIDSVYHVLNLSFEELPSYLKHCFLYLAHFPEDYQINMEKLSYYWAAEGIPRPRWYDGLTIREVGDGYIEELVKRNMVISERDIRTSRFEICQLHDMMREVCLHKAKEENFLQIVHNKPTAVNSKSRRLAVHEDEDINHLVREIKNPNIRSLLFIKMEYPNNWMVSSLCFGRLHLMRVLDLSFTKFEGGKVPSSIGELIHLRYLSLYEAWVTHLPSSMRNLKLLLYLNLQVRSRDSMYIPNLFKEMRELIYLSLTKGMDDKTTLELSNLVNLETLLNFSAKWGGVTDLCGMKRLRTLSIMFYKDFTVEALIELRHLESLDISLYGECQLEEDPMPILKNMVNLKELSLYAYYFRGRRMVCSAGGFPQLQKLSLRGLKEWEEWIVEEGSMPRLHVLTLTDCRELKELPHGMRFLTSLTDLNIIYMGEKWKYRLEKRRGSEYRRVQHIPNVIVKY